MEDNVSFTVNGNYKNALVYRKSCSSCFHVDGIKIPTLFYFALDDPLIGINSIDFKALK